VLIYQILANTLTDAARRLLPELRSSAPGMGAGGIGLSAEALLAANEQSPREHVIRQEEFLELSHELAQVPDDQRTALELKYLQGLSVEAISQKMG
jgi:RNA polymerase sigma factor (sigma-70 family)